MKEAPDEELMAAYCGGDAAAFEAALYEVAESLTKQVARDGEGAEPDRHRRARVRAAPPPERPARRQALISSRNAV